MKVYQSYLGRELDLEKLEKENGIVNHDGRILYLTQQAYVENYLDGVAYFANAVDVKGNLYQVRWDTTEEWELSEQIDESGACDWDNPASVELIDDNE